MDALRQEVRVLREADAKPLEQQEADRATVNEELRKYTSLARSMEQAKDEQVRLLGLCREEANKATGNLSVAKDTLQVLESQNASLVEDVRGLNERLGEHTTLQAQLDEASRSLAECEKTVAAHPGNVESLKALHKKLAEIEHILEVTKGECANCQVELQAARTELQDRPSKDAYETLQQRLAICQSGG